MPDTQPDWASVRRRAPGKPYLVSGAQVAEQTRRCAERVAKYEQALNDECVRESYTMARETRDSFEGVLPGARAPSPMTPVYIVLGTVAALAAAGWWLG